LPASLLPELRDDARFGTLPSRSANWSTMMQVVEHWTQRGSYEGSVVPSVGEHMQTVLRELVRTDEVELTHLRETGAFGGAGA
jgi:crotonobetainyl-CoA:carnitine CoA-transferase CaiB-like acyl-CoA transferase